jgi:hypothetical protein
VSRACGLVATCALLVGCSEPPFVTVTIEEGNAAWVNGSAGPSVEGSFQLVIHAPPAAETTELLLVDLAGEYRYPSCAPLQTLLSLSSDRSFPVIVEPGSVTRIDFTLGARDPLLDGCEDPEALALEGSYYDSVVDDYQDRTDNALSGEIALDIDPIVVGPSDYSCVGQLSAPTFQPGMSKGTVWLRDYVSGDLIPGAPIRVCGISDGNCDSPVDAGVTDIIGVWPLEVPTSSPYYYEVGSVPGFVSTLFFEYTQPGAPGFERTLTPMSEGELGRMIAALGAMADPARGHIIAGVLDCAVAPAVGVTLDVGVDDALVGYWQDGTPMPEATATTADGHALVGNLPPGPVTLVASLPGSGEILSTRLLHVRAGGLSFVTIDPRPSQR